MRALFVVNPAAGHGRALKRWRAVEPRAARSNPGSDVRLTARPGDGTLLALEGLKEGFEAIVAVGGDGTLGEVVHGYLGAPPELRNRAIVGTWPAGSGCDLARHLGIQGGTEILEALASPRVRRLDAGRVEFRGPDGRPALRHFLNVAAFGIAGDVARRVQERGKPWGGTISYMLDSLAEILQAKPRPIDLSIDGERQPRSCYHLVVLANTSTFGGGMRVAPDADPEDGLLDLVTVGGLSRWGLLRRFPKIYTGGHLREAGVGHRLVRRVEADSRETVHLNVDGDVLGTLPAAFTVLPGAVPFLCV